MRRCIFKIDEIDGSKHALAGGKGANLGELLKIEGIHVPDGFIVSTTAFRTVMENNSQLHSWLDLLDNLKPGDRRSLAEISESIRLTIEEATIENELSSEILGYLSDFDRSQPFAIRSSATAEDLPTASFAGQQDSYLNVVGETSIIDHVRKCWASLFTERAITYRAQNEIAHRNVDIAVVVQRMIFPQSSGILFTADPVTSNRKIVSIDASFGLGESLVAGKVNPDVYRVRAGRILDKKISAKAVAIHASKNGGTEHQPVSHHQQNQQTLTDEQILQLGAIGRKIEKHFGRPQDIEWCLNDDGFHIVQSRPITTLFPIPVEADNGNHVYISVGHQQMMTDAMKPLALSFWTTRAGMRTAGGRLFVDVTAGLSGPARENLLGVFAQTDPLIVDALKTVIDRDDFLKTEPVDKSTHMPIKGIRSMSTEEILALGSDPAVVTELIGECENALERAKVSILSRSGTELLQFIHDDLAELQVLMTSSKNLGAIMASTNASAWLNEKIEEWLGEKNVVDTLSQSQADNVTSRMGLALVELADLIRPYPELIRFLETCDPASFPGGLLDLPGGKPVYDAMVTFLDNYGMRCAGEIDVTRPRWAERPLTLIPLILSNVRNLEPGSARKKFEQGLIEAQSKKKELVARLQQLPGGNEKAVEVGRMIDQVRSFAGYREYPKYAMICRYFVYKQALFREASLLVDSGVLKDREDIYYLTFGELADVVRDQTADYELIELRKSDFKSFEKLAPPRVLTSDGETISGTYRRHDAPAGSLPGLAVSTGIVEGRARVILDLEDSDLEEGDILVTRFTDPSWTPLFVSIKGLITEVGGLMTHGAVIAREYRLPAVVGVANATRIIRDGQRIRVNGGDGYVELL